MPCHNFFKPHYFYSENEFGDEKYINHFENNVYEILHVIIRPMLCYNFFKAMSLCFW